ncbi:TfoX/Sxy family protein [Candidatus Stoquefichus sp. SB1]|jgi:DNA transformation protein|uniref:TfoX/Sxy family protein n=1 Tax=Candidatus Stoquefichus sp. SB1 TaxID=1658109 RepID=UPI00067F56C4|nr:TfoX/Sxy family protein [Candidatus Stoquefichus sp. SB1]
MKKLSEYPNIGPAVEAQLHQVGIDTMDQLQDIGSQEAWLKIQSIDSSACIHRLYSLEAAIQGIKKKDLSLDDKQYLKDFYNQHKLSKNQD